MLREMKNLTGSQPLSPLEDSGLKKDVLLCDCRWGGVWIQLKALRPKAEKRPKHKRPLTEEQWKEVERRKAVMVEKIHLPKIRTAPGRRWKRCELALQNAPAKKLEWVPS